MRFFLYSALKFYCRLPDGALVFALVFVYHFIMDPGPSSSKRVRPADTTPSYSKRVRLTDKDYEETLLKWLAEAEANDLSDDEAEDQEDAAINSDHDTESETEGRTKLLIALSGKINLFSGF